MPNMKSCGNAAKVLGLAMPPAKVCVVCGGVERVVVHMSI
jgi:hypothetical protein